MGGGGGGFTGFGTLTTLLNSANDPLGLFTSDNYQGLNVGGKHGIFGKTGESLWSIATTAGYQNPEEMDLDAPATVQGMSPEELEAKSRLAADTEAKRLRKRKGAGSTILSSMAGDTSTASVLKQTLGGA